MSKSVHYLLLLMVLIVPTGCETVHGTVCGAASGFSKDVQNISQDVQNASDSTQNAAQSSWNILQRADAWERQNLW